MRCRFPLQRLHPGWSFASLLQIAAVAVLAVAAQNPPGDGGGASANAHFNEVLDRENLRTLISRQLPKQGRFFEEFDGSE